MLQLVLNSAARMVCRVKKKDPVTPALHALHWLPIRQRIEYKILCLVFKALHGDAPQCLVDVLRRYQPGRLLRSAGQNRLVMPVSYNRYSERAFAMVGPRL